MLKHGKFFLTILGTSTSAEASHTWRRPYAQNSRFCDLDVRNHSQTLNQNLIPARALFIDGNKQRYCSVPWTLCGQFGQGILLTYKHYELLFYMYCSVHHNILLEITNRCNCMQWILFLCLVHSTCFGRHTRPSSGVQSSTLSTATGTIIGWRRLSRLLVPEDARHWLQFVPGILGNK